MSKLSIDVTTLPGWEDLDYGNHEIICRAKASGYLPGISNSVTVNKKSPYPVKGDLITLNVDGTDRQWRVIKANKNIAEVVLCKNDNLYKQYYHYIDTDYYENSSLDYTLNTTFYSTMTDTAKAAIVDKTFTQDSWYWGTAGDPDYSGKYGPRNPGTTSYSISLGTATYGNSITRHCYALSVQDVIDYVTDTTICDGKLQNYNIWKLFWDVTAGYSGILLWLRSYGQSSGKAFAVISYEGNLDTRAVYNTTASVRPAFQIDMSKIEWSKVE